MVIKCMWHNLRGTKKKQQNVLTPVRLQPDVNDFCEARFFFIYDRLLNVSMIFTGFMLLKGWQGHQEIFQGLEKTARPTGHAQ